MNQFRVKRRTSMPSLLIGEAKRDVFDLFMDNYGIIRPNDPIYPSVPYVSDEDRKELSDAGQKHPTMAIPKSPMTKADFEAICKEIASRLPKGGYADDFFEDIFNGHPDSAKIYNELIEKLVRAEKEK